MSGDFTSTSLKLGADEIPLDPEGYLLSLQDWRPEVGAALAEREGRQLDERHWEILSLLREFYQQYELSPAMRPLTKAIKQQLGDQKGSSMYLMMLFPEGNQSESPARIAARLAGLPKPTNCH